METQEIIGELYALRAGLSLIAQEKDKFDKKIDAADRERKETIASARAEADSSIRESNRDRIESSPPQSDESVKKAFNIYHDASKERKKNEEEIQYTEKYIEKYKDDVKKSRVILPIRFIIGLVFLLLHIASAVLINLFADEPTKKIAVIAIPLVIGITELVMSIKNKSVGAIWGGAPYLLNTLAFVGLILTQIKNTEGQTNTLELDVLLLVFSLFFTVMSFIHTLIRTIVYFKHDREIITQYNGIVARRERAVAKQAKLQRREEDGEKRYDEALKRRYEYQNDVDRKKAEHNYAVSIAEEKFAKISEEADKQYNAVYTAAATEHGAVCSGIYETLVKTYSILLDPRDWGILDLIIWQIETRRADTLKEALQLADRETQTDRIVNTMKSASAAIAQSLEDGFINLQTQLNSSFYSLAEGLSRATDIISSKISSSSEELASRIGETQRESLLATSKSLERLASQSTLQTALLEKSNTSSKDLVDAVKKLREAQRS